MRAPHGTTSLRNSFPNEVIKHESRNEGGVTRLATHPKDLSNYLKTLIAEIKFFSYNVDSREIQIMQKGNIVITRFYKVSVLIFF